MKAAIREIVRHFGQKTFYIIDDRSSVYLSTAINFIRDEFSNEQVRLNKLSDIVNLEEKPIEEIASLLKFYSSSTNSGKHVFFRIKLEDFFSLEEEISLLKKKGHPIILADKSLP